MKYILLIFVFVLSGCVGSQIMNQNTETLLSGSWMGTIEQITTKNLPDQKEDQVYEVIVLACTPAIEFWIKNDETGFHLLYSNYNIEEQSGNYLYHLFIEGEGWVETQSWTIISISETRASIQWNRMVNNIYLSENHEFRSFGQLGYGDLMKISEDCDIF